MQRNWEWLTVNFIIFGGSILEDFNAETKVELSDINKLTIWCENKNDADKYAFYIYKDNKCVEKIPYSYKNTTTYWPTELGEYKVKVFIKAADGKKGSKFTNAVNFEGLRPVFYSGEKSQKSFIWLRNVLTIFVELWKNRMRMIRISLYDYTLANKDSYLGKLWSILNPLIQIGTYWFVFGVGIRNNKPVGNHPFLPWMLCGLIPWFFISQGVVNGASSIYSKSGTALKLKYPISTIPFGSILVGFYNHLIVLCILAIMLFCFGYYPNLYWFNLIYYFIYEIIFLTSLAMVTSVLTMIARDFQKLIASLIRLWFYLTPILWNMDKLPEWVQFVLRLNPALYIVTGFRDSLIYKNMFYIHTNKILFFWTINLVLIIIGCNLQVKFRNKFIDML